jgi:hypothetical protein
LTRAGEITRRELIIAALGACLLAVVMHWPLPLQLGDHIPKDLGDPLPQAWQVAWGGHALAEQPLEFFQANQFWPEPDTLAFGDALIGYAPAGLIGDGPHAAVVRYDLLFLFAYALCFLGAYLLSRELGLPPLGAAVAGAAYAYAPFRLEQDGHMQVISSGGIPLALALGVRGIRLRRPWALFAAWAVAAWQLSIGFAIGLPFAYLLALLVAIGAVVWWRRGRPPVERRMLAAGAGGAALFLAVAAVIATPYLRVADTHPEATRPPSTVEEFSGPLSVFILNSDENWVWGDATLDLFLEINNPAEKTLFYGAAILLLALAGFATSVFPRWLRFSLGGAVVGISVLALGFQEEQGLLWPYRVVYEVLPGWEAIRTPGRLLTFSTLAAALLAGAGATWLHGRARERIQPRGGSAGAGRVALGALAAALVAVVVIEGRGLPFDPTDEQDQPVVPYQAASTADAAAPQLHLPALAADDNRRYLLWSTEGFPDIVNGRASTNPDRIEELIAGTTGFPDADSVERLRDYGVRTVVLHTDRTPGTLLEGAEAEPVDGLGLVRKDLGGGLVAYELRSPSAGSPETAPGEGGSSASRPGPPDAR